MGLTQELLTSQAETTAVTYDKLTGSFQDMFATVGQGIAQTLEPLANWFTTVFQAAADGIDQLNNIGPNMAELQGKLLEQKGSLEEYNATIARWNELLYESDPALRGAIPAFQELSQAQLDLANSLIEGGTASNIAFEQASKLSHVNTLLADSYAGIGVRMSESEAQITAFNEAAFALSVALDDGGAAALYWAGQVSTGAVSADEATQAMIMAAHAADEWAAKTAFFTAQQQAATAANEQATLSIFDENRELEDGIIKKGVATVATQELAAEEAYLTSLVDGVVAGQLSVGQAALQMAGELNVAEGEAYELINALAQLAIARQRLALEGEAKATGIKGMPADRQALDNLAAYRKLYAEQSKVREAEKKFNFEQANTAEQLRIKQNELGRYNQDTEEYWKTLSEVKRLEQQVANERKKGTGGGSGGGSKAKKSEAQKTNEDRLKDEKKLREDLIDIQTDYAAKMQEAELEHVEKIAEIYEDFYADLREAERENEQNKRRSRYDFYQGLDPDSGIDTSAFAAQYEEAFAEAQRIAQEGKAALSQEFLDLRQSQIQEMMDLEKEMADIRGDEDLNKGEKQRRLDYLEGLKKLLKDAQDEELKALLEGGDSNVNELNEQLTEEERRYAEQTRKIAEEVGKQADEKVIAAERSREAILKENEALQAQYGLLKDISATGAKPTVPSSVPAPFPPVNHPIPVETTAVSPDGNPVTQVDLWQVHDSVLNSTFLAVGARLEVQLSNILTAIDGSRDAITRSLGNLETVVSRLGQSSLVYK
jgi:hypothetical protein